MNIQKKIQRFFRVHGHSAGGFTLVELIVVIAILAILAGVAIPAYSGYIKKAQTAGDETLLDAVNTAFSAACALNGENNYGRKDVTNIKLENGLIPANYKFVNDDIDEDFDALYEGGKFEVYTELVYDKNTGSFYDVNNAPKAQYQYGDKPIEILQNSIDAFKNSVFAKNVEDMQAQLNGLSKAFSDVVGDADITGLFGEEFDEFIKDLPAEQRGNAAVLYVAQNSADMSAQDVANMFGAAGKALEGNANPSMRDLLEAFPAEEGGDPLTNMAVMYGAITGFANSDACQDDTFKDQVASVQNGGDLLNVFLTISDPNSSVSGDWGSYVGSYEQDGSGKIIMSDQFAADMNGFLGAMDAIDTVDKQAGFDKADEDLWNSENVNDLLTDVMGGK